MDVKSGDDNDQIITKEMKHKDLVEYSKIFASEFNNSSMHDRVLVFDYLDGDSGAGINALIPSTSDLKRKKKSCGDAVDRRKASLEEIKISKENLPRQPNADNVLSINNNVASRKFPDTACDHVCQKSETREGKEVGDKEEQETKVENERENRDTKGKKLEGKGPHVNSRQGEKIQNADGKENKTEEKTEKNEEKAVSERKNEEKRKEDEKSAEKNRGSTDDKAKDKEQANDGPVVASLEGKGKKVVGDVHEDKNSVSKENDAEKHKVFVHSSWLAVQSPYFRALFYSGMKESFSKEVVMKICRNELQAHLTLLEAMYRLDVLDDKEYELVAQVLILANKYDVQMVLRKCKYVLQSILVSTPLSLEKCECILHAVKDLTGCADIYDVLEKFLVKEFTPLDKRLAMEKFLELSEEALRLLLSSNDLAVQSENTVFVALMVWLENNEEISPDDSSLLSVVRFELMTVDFLYDFVRDHPQAKRMRSFLTYFHKGLAYHAFSQERWERLQDMPVQRLEFKDDEPSFSWVIDKDVRQDQKYLADGVFSDPFFCQGYELLLQLCYASDSKTYGFFLHVLNLKKGSFVNIRWRAQSKLFGSYLISSNEMYEEAAGWGEEGIQSDFPLLEIPEDVSHIIDVWIESLYVRC